MKMKNGSDRLGTMTVMNNLAITPRELQAAMRVQREVTEKRKRKSEDEQSYTILARGDLVSSLSTHQRLH